MYHYAIPLLEKKLEIIILHLDTNDGLYKSGTDILKDFTKLQDLILEKSPSWRHLKFVLIEKTPRKTMEI